LCYWSVPNVRSQLDYTSACLSNIAMHSVSRLFIATFTIFAMLVSIAWTASPEVLHDVMESDSPALVFIQKDPAWASVENIHHGQTKQDQSCNHGCHASSHLLGFIETGIVGHRPSFKTAVLLQPSTPQINNPFLQGPFRPPLSQPLV